MRKSLEERFWEKVNIKNIHDCWDWQSSINNDGYGQFWIKGHSFNGFELSGKQQLAHRISWLFKHGILPKENLVCHTCDNRRCVNPNHLFLGSSQDNMNDKVVKGRAVGGKLKGEEHGKSKLTQEQIIAIRKSNFTQKTLAQIYNVKQNTISMIKNNKIWKHLGASDI